jgi:hypothetical protein
MVDSLHFYGCNGFEPLCAISAPEAARQFAKAMARKIYGADAYVDGVSLEEFSPDGRIQRYTVNVCREGERSLVWLCVNRIGHAAEGFQ